MPCDHNCNEGRTCQCCGQPRYQPRHQPAEWLDMILVVVIPALIGIILVVVISALIGIILAWRG